MSSGWRVVEGLKNVMSEVRVIFKKDFVYLDRICWSEEVIQK